MSKFEYLLDDNDVYQRYKNSYSVYYGYLILKNTLDTHEMKLIEKNYQEWESVKSYGLLPKRYI